jgi:hypothetical protein
MEQARSGLKRLDPMAYLAGNKIAEAQAAMMENKDFLA